jgi:uncharacterized membrane protein YoaT (DUF817 family)
MSAEFVVLAVYMGVFYVLWTYREQIAQWVFHRMSVCRCPDGWRACRRDWER